MSDSGMRQEKCDGCQVTATDICATHHPAMSEEENTRDGERIGTFKLIKSHSSFEFIVYKMSKCVQFIVDGVVRQG
jgi:hypothetical protein